LSLVDQLLAERYRIERLLARGGMADVYLATDERLDRQVAVKVIYPHLASDPRFTQKFIREAKTAAKLNHPNLVNVFDQGTANGQTFMVMEYVPGMTLREALDKYGKLPPLRALDLLDAILQGLAAAHRAGILHRDLKPENVFLSDDGRIKLGDFGLAREANSATSTGSLLGTIAYIAPELLTRGQADARSDVYSMGIMLYEFLTGKQPWDGEDVAHIAHQHTTIGVGTPSAAEKSVPPLLDELVLWTTAISPAHRPANAQVLAEVAQRVRAEVKAGNGKTARLDLPQFSGVAATKVISVDATVVIEPLVAPEPEEARANSFADLNTTQNLGEISRQTATYGATSVIDTDADSNSFSLLEELALKRRRRGKWVAAAILAFTLFCSGAGWWFSSGPGGMSALPDLTSSTLANAKSVLAPYSQNLKVVKEFSSTVSDGLVTHTEPKAGSLFFRGSGITVFVSKGANLKAVPSLIGLDLTQAQKALESAGFVIGQAQKFFGSAAANTVFQYLGSDGNKVAAGSTVPLKLSAGPMPDIVGKSQTEATATLKSAGLSVASVAFDYSDTVATGEVIKVNPTQDPLPVNGSVTLVVSKGPTTVVVPNLVGETLAASELALKTLGLVVVVNTDQLQSNWGMIKIKTISVPSGTVVKRGSQIIISNK